MAESKGALIAKSVQKHAGRAKEKLLQNLGKVDRTLDDIFEEHLQNFNRQHQQATRLQKEFNNYIRCIRAVQTASKSLMEAITEAYESGWSGHDLLYVQAQNMEMLWQDFSHKLGDQVLIPLNTYTNQFPEVRKKVEKRGRKLVDYDSQRHSFQNLQANAAKRRDDVKVTKGREQLEEAKRTYEVLNSELHDELPALFDSRVLFYVHNLQTLFSAEQLFHGETSKVFAELEAITDKLATDCQRGSYSKRNNGAPPPAPPHAHAPHAPALNGNAPGHADTVQTPPATPPSPGWAPLAPPASPERPPAPATPPPPSPRATPGLNGAPPPPARRDQSAAADGDKPDDLYDIPVGSPVTPEKLNNNSEEKQEDIEQIETNNKTNEDQSKTDNKIDESQSKTENKTNESQNKTEDKLYENQNKTENKFNESQTKIDNKPDRQSKTDSKSKDSQSKTYNISNDNQSKTEEVYDIPVGATLAGLPAGALYRVRATYRYTREDSDELSFDVGDVIRVVEYDDPDEQEEGWLMGIKETTNEKGMFPANFTRPI